MEQNSNDTFASENSGTAKFVGGVTGDCAAPLSGATAMTCNEFSSSVATTSEFQTIKPGKILKTCTRTEISHSELLKMLSYLEGELQARDVVIAALRNERVKQYITQLRTKRMQANDPYAALFRDKIILSGNLVSRESSVQAAQAEMEVRQIIEQQMEQQYQMVNKQRATHMRMVNVLTESLEKNQRMLQELEDEKRKHEHDTAQGDDITYGLEMERTKLRQELEDAKGQVKKLEKDVKKLQETLDYERNRQKQIVLLLIAERKKIMMKYIEEGKRSEDLAQILAEEKQRSDTIAEGLEEESKKSLRMEEEIEKQAASFDQERKTYKITLAKEELRIKELEQEILTLKAENELLRKQQQQLPTKARPFNDDGCATSLVNIAKIVQPTATVSSMPVSGPTTGIARSLTPGQSIRAGVVIANTASSIHITQALSTNNSSNVINEIPAVAGTVGNISGPVSGPLSPVPGKIQSTATIQRAPGTKYSALVSAVTHSLDQAQPLHPMPIAIPPVIVPASIRGTPPPIPPNKPIVPPKREPSLSRLASITSAASVAALAASSATNAKIN